MILADHEENLRTTASTCSLLNIILWLFTYKVKCPHILTWTHKQNQQKEIKVTDEFIVEGAIAVAAAANKYADTVRLILLDKKEKVYI